MLGTTQAGGCQPFDELAAAHRQRAGVDQFVSALCRHVVVVPLKGPLGDPARAGECVQLVEGAVADQVAPQPPAPWPRRRIDQDRHPRSVRGAGTGSDGQPAPEAMAPR